MGSSTSKANDNTIDNFKLMKIVECRIDNKCSIIFKCI